MLDDIATIRESQDIPHEYYDYVYDSVAFSHTDMLLVQGAVIRNLLVDFVIKNHIFKVLLSLHCFFSQIILVTSMLLKLKFKTF